MTAPAASALAAIGLLERNRTLLARAGRSVRAAAGLAPIAASDDPASVLAALSPDARVLACDAADLDLVLGWRERFPRARVIAWSTGPMDALVAAAARAPCLQSAIGWPAFHSMPRAWEIALAVRHALGTARAPLDVTEPFAGAPALAELRPRTSAERDAAVTELASLAERAGASARIAARIGEVAHELLMNAMYDAPVNHYGEPRYAHDRAAAIALDDHEVPTARFATDGALLALQVVDPFGRLARARVLAGIARGQAAAADGAAAPIDASHGGAGLGLWKSYAAAAALFVDVTPGDATSVTAVFDLDVGPREARAMPPSLHVFERGSLPR